MNNLKSEIIKTLQNRGPLLPVSIEWAVKKKTGASQPVVQAAIDELESEGHVSRHEDGKRYQLTDSGPVPPEAA